MSITLRLMEAKDKPACLALFNQIIAEGQSYPWDEPFSMADFDCKYPAHEPVWLAVGQGEVCGEGTVSAAGTGSLAAEELLGFVHIHPNASGRMSHVANCGYGVAKAARGRGIGKMLVAKSIEEIKKAGYKGVQFNAVVSTNTAAIKLYQDFGFKTIGIIPKGFRLDNAKEPQYVDAFIMYLGFEDPL